MKKIFSILLALMLFSQNAFCAWDKSHPAGTDNVSDIDLYSVANNTALESTLSGMTGWANLKATTGGSATTVTVTADMLMLQASASIAYRATSVSESIAITTSGASGLVSSLSEAANTIYYVWIARKSSDSTVNGYLSTTTSLTTFLTQVDSGYDQAALVSVVGNDGSSNFLDYTQEGLWYWFKAWKTMASGNVGTASWTAIDTTPSTLSFFVPTSLSTITFGNTQASNAAPFNTAISNINTSSPLTNVGQQIGTVNVNGPFLYWQFNIITTDTLYWASNGPTCAVYLGGFYLNLL